MSISSRLMKIEIELNKSNEETIFRLVGCDGSYSEQKEDIQRKVKVIQVVSEGVSSEDLRSWAV